MPKITLLLFVSLFVLTACGTCPTTPPTTVVEKKECVPSQENNRKATIKVIYRLEVDGQVERHRNAVHGLVVHKHFVVIYLPMKLQKKWGGARVKIVEVHIRGYDDEGLPTIKIAAEARRRTDNLLLIMTDEPLPFEPVVLNAWTTSKGQRVYAFSTGYRHDFGGPTFEIAEGELTGDGCPPPKYLKGMLCLHGGGLDGVFNQRHELVGIKGSGITLTSSISPNGNVPTKKWPSYSTMVPASEVAELLEYLHIPHCRK